MMHLSDWHWLCATDPHREHLAFLWLREDRGENRVYASDGRTMISAPATVGMRLQGREVPDVAQIARALLDQAARYAEHEASLWGLIRFAGPLLRSGPECRGCAGTGTARLPSGALAELAELADCALCGGSGSEPVPRVLVEVHGVPLSASLLARHLWAIVRLGSGDMDVARLNAGPDRLLIRCGGAESLVMWAKRARGDVVVRSWPEEGEA